MAAVRAAADQAAARADATPARLKETVGDPRWQGRPLLGTAVRVLAMAIPVIAAVSSAIAASRMIDRPADTLAMVGWFALVTAISTVVLVVVDRAARRLLPLAALLRLTMAFPDRAPSRFSVAFKAGTTRDLKARLARAKEHGVDDEPSQSAARILTLVGAMSAHDRGTRGHSERVRAFNDLIAEEMGLPQADRDRLRWAALLHDVGKLHVPNRILNKPGKPTEKEWAQLRRHPEEGAKIAAPLAGWLGPWAAAIEQHHERWDGGGYPKGLAAENISLAARIVAVADTFEVITAPRPYKRPVNAQAAREELARCAGSHFDPAVVRAFLNVSIGRIRLAMGPLSWLAQLPFLGSVPRLEGYALAAGRSAVTAAGTATGVGALALTGMVTPASTASSHGANVNVLQDGGRVTAQVQGAVAAPTGARPASDPAPASPAHPAPGVAPSPEAGNRVAGPDKAQPKPESRPRRTVQPEQPAPEREPDRNDDRDQNDRDEDRNDDDRDQDDDRDDNDDDDDDNDDDDPDQDADDENDDD
jgi:putative nucleotidyltransferase with HDIG domain